MPTKKENMLIDWREVPEGGEFSTPVWYKGEVYHVYNRGCDFEILLSKRPFKNNSPNNSPWFQNFRGRGRIRTFYLLNTDESCCAFDRLHIPKIPRADIGLFDFYLSGLEFNTPTLAYVTDKDGPVPEIITLLKTHGFEVIAVTRSREGRHKVYKLLREGENSKKLRAEFAKSLEDNNKKNKGNVSDANKRNNTKNQVD